MRLTANEVRCKSLQEFKSPLQSTSPPSIIGIVGNQGAGKSTVVLKIEKRFEPSEVCVIPMDGNHLSDEKLIELGRRDRKDAPDTFPTQALISLINKVRNDHKSEHKSPIFHHEIEASKEGEEIVPIGVKVIVIEAITYFHTDIIGMVPFPCSTTPDLLNLIMRQECKDLSPVTLNLGRLLKRQKIGPADPMKPAFDLLNCPPIGPEILLNSHF